MNTYSIEGSIHSSDLLREQQARKKNPRSRASTPREISSNSQDEIKTTLKPCAKTDRSINNRDAVTEQVLLTEEVNELIDREAELAFNIDSD
jgi:hypothetical protein